MVSQSKFFFFFLEMFGIVHFSFKVSRTILSDIVAQESYFLRESFFFIFLSQKTI